MTTHSAGRMLAVTVIALLFVGTLDGMLQLLLRSLSLILGMQA